MVLLRESGMPPACDCQSDGRIAEHGEPSAHGLMTIVGQSRDCEVLTGRSDLRFERASSHFRNSPES